MALTLHVCPRDSGAVVWASGDVDTNVAETFQDMMLSVMREHSPSLLLDLSGVSFMDCAGLRALLLTHRRAGMRGGSVSLLAEAPAVRRIIDLLGVRDVFPVRERLSELSAILLSLLSGAEPQRSSQGRPWPHHPFPPGPGAGRDHDRGQAPQPVRADVNRAVWPDYRRGDLPRQRQPLLLPVPAPPVPGAGQRPAVGGDRSA